MSHTILLIQPAPKPETRTYSDFESVNECMEAECADMKLRARPASEPRTPLPFMGQPYPLSYSGTPHGPVQQAVICVCKIYEEHLKRQNPNTPSITYDISQLFDFVDQLTDLSCLVYQKSTNSYAPYNKDWIKEKIYVLLRRQAARSQ